MLVILSVGQPSDWQCFHPDQRPKNSKTTDDVYTCTSSLVWFQKISIPPPWRELEIPVWWWGEGEVKDMESV